MNNKGWPISIVGLLLLLLLIIGCGVNKTSSPIVEEVDTDPVVNTTQTDSSEIVDPAPLQIDLDAIPPVNLTKHTVPLSEIYFDTFRRFNRVVPLTDISPDMIRDLRDAIPPIYHPKFESRDQGDTWLSESDIVVGYAAGDEAYAYPVRILNWHEMAAHQVNGHPILATY